MKENYKVSIIVPVYNRERFLDKCINSLLNQKYKNVEIILIDDGSIDNSYNICKSYASKDIRVKVFYQDNAGVQMARNKGIHECSGDFITFVDADDYVTESYIYDFIKVIDDWEFLHEKERDLSQYPLVVCGHYRVDKDGNSLSNNDYLLNCKNLIQNNDNNSKWALYFERFACYCWNHLYVRNIVINNNIKFDKNICIYDDTAFTMNYIRCVDEVCFTFTNNYYYVCEHDDMTVTKRLNKKRVAEKGSLEKLETCIKLHEKCCKENNSRLSSVLYVISMVCCIMYGSSVLYDYRLSKAEKDKLFDECYYLVKGARITSWYFEENLLLTKLPSLQYVKIASKIIDAMPKCIFKLFCYIFGNEQLSNFRIKMRLKRMKNI